MAKKRSASRNGQSEPAGGTSISIGGNVGGAVVTGSNNLVVGNNEAGGVIIQGSGNAVFSSGQQAALARAATPEEVAALTGLFTALNQNIAQQAPADVKEKALEQAGQLKDAVAADKPNVDAMAKAKAWFADNLPTLLGTVTGLLTNPIVGKLVELGGEFTIAQFRQRLGLPPKP